MVNQAKLQSFQCQPIYKFGVQTPHYHQEAMEFDAQNGNNNWATSENTELNQILENKTFKDLNKHAKPCRGYKKI